VVLAPGTRVGGYEITGLIGAGGMGEVYRAHDSKLKRDVALKVLPAEVANNRERLARFQREAEVLASLNHHNIAHIHGIEESNGMTALVMELVEGEDLAQRIVRGPIPIDEALPIAQQVAEALECAHDAGIIHRDLKPANIKVRDDGTVKVLDFGLAKALAPQDLKTSGPQDLRTSGPQDLRTSGPQDLANSPTITSPAMTQRGVILGTAAYMSPEQAKGKVVDRRTDIWAFGCVLFEMLTGRRAFAGDTTTETFAAILERDPDWNALPPTTPAGVRRLLRRTLEKKAAVRLRDIADAKPDLVADQEPPPKPRSARWPTVAVVIGVALLASAATALIMRPQGRASAAEQKPLLFTVPMVSQQVPISADGRTVAWIAPGRDGVARLWVRRLDAIAARELAGTEGAQQPFLAPDGRAIAFFQRGLLKRVDVNSGAVQTLSPTATVSPGGSWSAEDVIIFSNRYGLQRVPASGGTPQLVVPLNPEFRENSLRYPQFLPDGRHFVYVARSGRPEDSGAYLGSLDGASRRLFSTLGKIAFAAPDQLLYVREGTLLAQQFDVRTGALTGSPRTVISDVFVQPTGLNAFYWVADNGTMTYVPSRPEPDATLQWFDRAGRNLGALDGPRPYNQFRISRDGSRVAAAIVDQARGGRSVWLLEAGHPPARFTFPETHDWEPVWSPDGRRIAFGSYRNGPIDIYVKALDGSSGETPLLRSENQKDPSDWSPDGKYILFRDTRENAAGDVVAVEVAEPQRKIEITKTPGADERIARWSGDGKWIAYVSNETGIDEIFVQPFPPTGGRWQVSVGGGDEPVWRADGRELYYIDANAMLVAVSVDGTPASFTSVRSRPLFRIGSPLGIGFAHRYDAVPDGSRFLVQIDAPQPPPRPPVVIVNWPALASAR
jgi:Tol biopolymer transport system component